MLFAEPLANSQVVAWSDMDFVAEQNCVFIIVPIVVYLPFVVNHCFYLVQRKGHTPNFTSMLIEQIECIINVIKVDFGDNNMHIKSTAIPELF